MPRNKLSPAQVAALRRSYAEGNVTQQELANQYGICKGHVSRIVNGKSGATEPVIANVFRRIADGLDR
jgi:plasmid maintenance system antidote protein VapI